MATGNIANATGLSMNWVDERNASAQSRYAQDVTAWTRSLLDAARSQSDEAGLAQRVGSQANGTRCDLSPKARTLVRQDRLTALETAPASAQNESSPAPITHGVDGGDCDDRALDGIHVSAEPVQAASSDCPIQPLPAEVLSADPLMQAWYESILAAAREIDPNATIDNSIGIARVLVNGRQTILTGPMYDEFAQGYATPAQQVNRGVTGAPIALTAEQLLRVAQYQVQSLNSSLSDLSAAEAQTRFDAMRPSLNGVPGEVCLSIGSQRFPVALQDGKIVLSGPAESWDSITGNPPLAGPTSEPGPRLVTYSNGMQGYVGPDGTKWIDPAASQTSPAWGSSATPFDGYGGSVSPSPSATDPSAG